MYVMLNILNQTRFQYHLAPLKLNLKQSLGSGSCVGSFGHSKAMADDNNPQAPIWHTAPDAQYNYASFPYDLCLGLNGAENVGYSATSNELQDLNTIESMMMSEPHDPYPQACDGVLSHACNILTANYPEVGIGIYQEWGRTYITEDFVP